jgi:hypothetical protein
MRNTLVSLTLLVISTICLGQTKNGTATANGQCSIAISGNNNTVPTAKSFLDSCGIGKEQGEKIIQLLNTVFAKRDAVQINAKLNELIEIAKKPVSQVLNCVGSNCVQNGSQFNYDERTYGVPKPLPDVINLRTDLVPSDSNPGVTVTFGINKPFSNPMFAIYCDRPCMPQAFSFGDGQGHSWWSGQDSPFLSTNSPNIWVTQYGSKNIMLIQEFARATFQSRDNQPIEIIKVEAYSQ